MRETRDIVERLRASFADEDLADEAAAEIERLRKVVNERANIGHDWTTCLCTYCEEYRDAFYHGATDAH